MTLIERYYKENFDRLVKRIARRSGTRESAEDIVQNAFVRALVYFDSYDDKLPLPNWFNRILNNCLKEYKNQEKGFAHAEFDEEEVDGVACKQYADNLWKQIRGELDSYEEHHQEVLHLYFIHGYRPRDIERVTDLKYRNVETIIQRFKTYIKDKYGEAL